MHHFFLNFCFHIFWILTEYVSYFDAERTVDKHRYYWNLFGFN